MISGLSENTKSTTEDEEEEHFSDANMEDIYWEIHTNINLL